MAHIYGNTVDEIPGIELTIVGGSYAKPSTPTDANQVLFHVDNSFNVYLEKSDASLIPLATSLYATFKDSVFRITGSADTTKLLAFEVDGFTPATTRTITVPDVTDTMVTRTTGTFTDIVTITKTTQQLSLNYDGSNKAAFTVSSGGDLTIAPTGGDTSITGTLAVSGHAAVNTTISTTDTLNVAETYTDIAATSRTAQIAVTHTITSNNSNGVRGAALTATINQNGFNATSSSAAIGNNVNTSATGASGTVTGVIGTSSAVSNTGAGTVTSAYAFQAGALINSGGGVVTGFAAFQTGSQTAASNNTYILLGTATIPTGNFAIYSTTTNGSSIAGHTIFGPNTTPSSNTVLAVLKTFTDISTSTFGVDGFLGSNYTAANAQVVIGTRGQVSITQTGGNVTNTVGGRGVQAVATAAGTTNTVTGLSGLYAQAGNTNTGTVTNSYGVYIDAGSNSGGGTVTNNYGLYIVNQTVGGTLNRAIKTNTGLLEFGDAAAFGGATPVATSQITINKAYTDPAATVSAVDATSSASFTGANAQSIQSLRGIVSISYTGGAYTGNPAGVRGTVTIAGTTNSSTSAMAFWAAVTHSGSGTLSNGYGLRIDSAANSGGGTFTTNYGVYVDTQTVGGTNYAFFANGAGRFSVVGSDTIASAAGATWNGIEHRAATATITGSANITTATGFNYTTFAQPTLSAASALTVTNAATVYIANAPTGAGAGPATITNAYALWVDNGVARFDGNLDLSSASIDVLVNSSGLNFRQATVGNAVVSTISTATNDDPTEIVYQNRVATTDATVTTLHTFTVPASTTYAIEAVVVARRTGGSAGTAEDGARYRLSAVYKNAAGTATIIGVVTQVADESQAGWDGTFDTTGATVRVRVTGAVNNNITWHVTARVYPVGT